MTETRSVKVIDIEAELRNWAMFVQYGDDGSPDSSDLCGSIEKEYATHLSRFQYESRMRAPEPRIQDGYLLERLICDPAFPAIWRRVIYVQYLYLPDGPGAWEIGDTYEDKLATRAARARVSTRSYPDYLDGARNHLDRVLTQGKGSVEFSSEKLRPQFMRDLKPA